MKKQVNVLILSNVPHYPSWRRQNKIIVFAFLTVVGVFVLAISVFRSNMVSLLGDQRSTQSTAGNSKAVDQPILVTNFNALRKNALGFYQDTDGTMPTYALVPGGVKMVANSASYWYSMLVAGDTSTCFSTTATYLRISASGLNATNGKINIALSYSTAATGCLRSKTSTFTISKWIVDPATGEEIGEVALTSFIGLVPTRMHDIAFNSPIAPLGVVFTIHSISFAFESYFNGIAPVPPKSTTKAGATTVAATTTTTAAAPGPTSVLITSFNQLYVNALGLPQDHDNTLTSYSLSDSGAVLVSNVNSYWYSDLSNGVCYSTSAKYLRVYGRGFIAAGGSLKISLVYSKALTGCAKSATGTVVMNNWVLDPVSGFEVGEVALSAFAVDLTKLHHLAFDSPILPHGTQLTIRSIYFEDNAFTATPPVLPSLASYQALAVALRSFIAADLERVRKYCRIAFHDLFNYDPIANPLGGPHGCIFNPSIVGMPLSNGLSDAANALSTFVQTKFPNVKFPLGDVASLAGKVSVEIAYPGIRIPWRYGRSPCNLNAVAGKQLGPGPDMSTLTALQPFLTRYGLSAEEMAVLTIGGHSIARARNSQANTGIADFYLSNGVSSGIQFIKSSSGLTLLTNWYGKLGQVPVIGRFFSDLMYFPDLVAATGSGKQDNSPVLKAVQTKLLGLTTDAQFNALFQAAFAKMLEIGTLGEKLVAYTNAAGAIPPVVVPPLSNGTTGPNTPVLITDFSSLTTNALKLPMDHDNTLTTYALATGGATFQSTPASYWYTELTDKQKCYSTDASYIRIAAKGFLASKGGIYVRMEYSNAATGCQNNFNQVTLMNNWVLDPASGYEIGEVPIFVTAPKDKQNIFGIAFDAPITPTGVPLLIHNISFTYTRFSTENNAVNTIGTVPTFGTCTFQAECQVAGDTCCAQITNGARKTCQPKSLNCPKLTDVGLGTPNSIPGISFPATVANPGRYDVIAVSPIASLAVAPIPFTNRLAYLERASVYGGSKGTTNTYDFDYVTKTFYSREPTGDMFCVGGGFNLDGTLYVFGGSPPDGVGDAVRFLKSGGEWTQNDNLYKLQRKRWYPTGLVLPNGQIAVIGGQPKGVGPTPNEPTVEFLPNTQNRLVTLDLLVKSIGNNLYPYAYIVTNSQGVEMAWVFARADSCLYNPYTFDLIECLPTVPTAGLRISNAPAAMLPLVAGPGNVYPLKKIMICGGTNAGAAMNSCIITTPALGAAATWTVVNMPFGRVLGEMMTLPDGNLLILSGANRGDADFGGLFTPILTAVLYNPVTNQFSVLASTTIARLYHNNAVLVADGRVIVSSSTPNENADIDNSLVLYPTERRIEAFSPPYLLSTQVAPTINSVSSTTWGYGQQFTIQATIPSGNTNGIVIRLINPGFVTHSNHMSDAHFVLLINSIVATGANTFTITVTSPPNAKIAQPQHYYLWVVDGPKPCSKAQWIKLGTSATSWL